MLNSIDTGSQVCNLVWCKNVNEIVSTHGYSENQIMVWKYPSMSKIFQQLSEEKSSTSAFSSTCSSVQQGQHSLVKDISDHLSSKGPKVSSFYLITTIKGGSEKCSY